MKRRIAALLGALLLIGCATVQAEGMQIKESNADHFGDLLINLLNAYETPSAEDALRIDAALEAIRAVDDGDYRIGAAIAEHWRRFYLNPDYTLHIYQRVDPAAALALDGVKDSETHAFAVLGYELKRGEMTTELQGRCDAAAATARAFPHAIIVCSGGATGSHNRDHHTEAGLMKDYLVQRRGIDASRIFTDETALNTADNALNTLEILRRKGVQTMTIITSSYHQRWGETLYHAVAALYERQYGYSVEIISNFCYETEPEVAAFRQDDRFAITQMGEILHLPQRVMKLLPQI